MKIVSLSSCRTSAILKYYCPLHSVVFFQSGLTEAVKRSEISLDDARKTMVSFVREYTAKGSCPLAGNTVHADKAFLVKYMPDFMEHLHYRIVDVSTIKELCRYVLSIDQCFLLRMITS